MTLLLPKLQLLSLRPAGPADACSPARSPASAALALTSLVPTTSVPMRNFVPIVFIDAVILEAAEGSFYLLEVLEVVRYMLLFLLEPTEGVHYVLEPLEVIRRVQ